MDLPLVADPVTALGFSKFASTNLPSDQHSTASAVLQISAAIYNSIARPPVKKNPNKAARRSLLKRKRRVKKKSSDDDSGGDSGGGEDSGSFGGDGGGGFLGGGGGRGWNYDGFGWDDDEFSWFAYSSPAAYWFQDVFIWIVVGACLHFAIQRVVRIMSDGIGDAENEKVPRLC